ncbi:MAG: cation transporter, partial [Gammaproteobacteria bacterium]|nr:cation transporter [Gammaproteobacteria bacterium]
MSNTYLAFDRPDVAATFVRRGKHQTSEVLLLVEDIRCTACCLAIEKALAPLAGITEVQVNPATRHARIQWNSAQLSLSCIMQTIADCGFTPLPLSDDTVAAVQREQSRAALRRLFVAGLGMMQLMTYAVATYAGAFDGISDTYLEFFRLLSLLVATPVVFYSAGPFFRGAIRDLVRGRAGMDVPVAVAIGLAYLASVLIVLFGKLHTEIYFDSVVMFTFFLSCGRFIEMVARHRSIGSGEALAQSVPATAQRFDAGGGTTTVPTRILQVNDRLLIRSGETIPADAVVTRGESSTDEALLTGESVPRRKRPGDTVIAGSLNLGAPLEVKVTRTGADTILSGISHMLE